METTRKPYDWSKESGLDISRNGSELPCPEKSTDDITAEALTALAPSPVLFDRNAPEHEHTSFANLAFKPHCQTAEKHDRLADVRYIEAQAAPQSSRLANIHEEISRQKSESRKDQLAALAAAAVYAYLLFRWGYEILENDRQMLESIRENTSGHLRGR